MAKPSPEDFTLVAELASDGSPTEVALRPETNIAKCVSARFVKLRFPSPPEYPGRRGFPIVLDMHIHRGRPPNAD